MNRGRRRAGPGLTGLRDGVKRRLFDPHLVPTRPDEKAEINRLLPVSFANPSVQSLLTELRKSKEPESALTFGSASEAADKLRKNLFHSKALFELAFRCGPFHHQLSESAEGIDVSRVYGTTNAMEPKSKEPVLLAHLLLTHRELDQWSGNTLGATLSDPESWYPKELIQFTKPGRNTTRAISRRNKTRTRTVKAANDLDELVTDQFIQQEVKVTEEDELVDQPGPERDQQQDSGDSDDARWNGEINADADPDEVDEDELENDYCQTYFDNGEGELSDTGLGGIDDEDDARSKYYD